MRLNQMRPLSAKNFSSPEACGKRVRFLREDLLFYTREEFCHGSKLTVAALKGWELGWGGGLSLSGAKKIILHCRKLNMYCTEAWLLHGIGRSPAPITKKLDLAAHDNDEAHIAKELLLFRELDNTIDSMVTDDAMMPLVSIGDYVAGILAKDISKVIGKECIILAEDNETYIRVVEQSDKVGHYHLNCLNKKSLFYKQKIKDIRIKMVAPILWIRRVNAR